MITSFFIPEFWGIRRLRSIRIATFAVLDNAVVGALVQVTRAGAKVLEIKSVPLGANAEVSLEQQIVQALAACAPLQRSAQHVKVILPASLVICKELVLPLADREKIELVIGFELESSLPFAAEHALIDFIMVDKVADQQGTQIVAAVARRSDVLKHLALYQQAGIEPAHVTVDIVGLAGLVVQAKLTPPQVPSALVYMDAMHTTIALVHHGVPRMVRTIPLGVTTLLEQIASEALMPLPEIVRLMEREGVAQLGTDQCARITHQHLMQFCQQIQFTLNSFGTKVGLEKPLEQVVCAGQVDRIKGIATFVGRALIMQGVALDTTVVASVPGITCSKELPEPQPLLLGSVLSLPATQQFDMAKTVLLPASKMRLRRHLYTACVLALTVVVLAGGTGFWRARQLSQAVVRYEQEQISLLKKADILPANAFAKGRKFAGLLSQAQKLVEEKKELWAPFSGQRLRPLPILAELVKIIDKKRFDVTIDRVEIGSDPAGVRAVVDGFFKSRTGSSHFTHFAELETRFKESTVLRLTEPINESLAEDKGVHFVANMTLKEPHAV